ncbi:HIRAN domain-containing protein [Paenibacillus pasadenensis]|uniref:HIRAN domain-containing protein n=1 Tax=Paenibacillus pasadenensis TaxID=217090 RepID=UPI001580EE87|nr:HIRAN domain-containing protein [Paenibacillus pasadenensis]
MEKEETMHVTLTGMSHYCGAPLLKPGLAVALVKEPDHPLDAEAIRVELPPIGKIGYVANSTHTVARGCLSAGRLYDRIGRSCLGTIRFVWKDAAIVELRPDLDGMAGAWSAGEAWGEIKFKLKHGHADVEVLESGGR